jgi:hypothetical protein
MAKPSPRLLKFMETYKVDADEVWEVRTGGAWAIKHSALERVAAERGITFELPQLAEKDSANRIVAMLVVANMGDRREWAMGEASPANNKNAYCYAMAEKRGKDRCILKLLNAHGSVYSEEEADDFKPRQNPHVTKPSDIVPEVEYDEHGVPVDNIPLGDDGLATMNKALSKKFYAELQSEMHAIVARSAPPRELMAWGEKNKNRVGTLHPEFQEYMRGDFKECLEALRQPTTEAAE